MANTTGKKFGGRKKGTPNKQTKEVKQNLVEAFEKLGGIDNFVKWGRENETEFYKLWTKILPSEIKADITNSDGSLSITERLLRGRQRALEDSDE